MRIHQIHNEREKGRSSDQGRLKGEEKSGDSQRNGNYHIDLVKLKGMQRKLVVKRLHLYHQIAIKLLSMSTVWNTEFLSFEALQKLFGRSVGFRAPSVFVEKLRLKAANAGGELIMIDT